MKSSLYINAASCISPQPVFGAGKLPAEPQTHSGNRLNAIEPDYKLHLNIPAARRMSRLIKMGVCTALDCLKSGAVQVPDAIIAGTGLGCMEDSEKFLASLITNNEQTLSPTSFIFSTHNTVAAQVALLLKCNNYNFTHTHRGLSFEHSLVDAMLYLNDNPEANVLAGAADEVTDSSFKILQRLGAIRQDEDAGQDLKDTSSRGSIAGEGSAFFILNKTKKEGSLAKLAALETFSNPENGQEVLNRIQSFSSEHNFSDEDLFLLGINGDVNGDRIYHEALAQKFKSNPVAYYKHLCGEYHTSTAFACWAAAMILKNASIPSYMLLDSSVVSKPVKRALIFNHYKGREFSLLLLEQC